VVLAIPNGGVVIAAEVARTLTSPFDVIGVRKLRTPGEPELALGAVAEHGVQVLNQVLVEEAGLSTDDLEQLTAAARAALGEQLGRYRAVRPAVPLQGRTAVLVDDGLTTGSCREPRRVDRCWGSGLHGTPGWFRGGATSSALRGSGCRVVSRG
jgi:putative phosphoribosyl transferase